MEGEVFLGVDAAGGNQGADGLGWRMSKVDRWKKGGWRGERLNKGWVGWSVCGWGGG